MEIVHLLPITGLSLMFLTIVFIPMEKVFPAKPGQKTFRQHWRLDLCFFLGQYLLWNGLVLWLLRYFSQWIGGIVPQELRHYVQEQPFWLQAIVVIILSDLFIYWGHRLQHNNSFLWRFHKVHHSAEHMDWLAAHREHPLDSIYTIALINLPAFLLGFNLGTLAALIAFRGIWAIYIHSNVRLNLGPIKYIIGSPEMHHWHHYKERDAGNYGNISPMMDIIFGTHYSPPHEPEAFGIPEKLPQNYAAQMLLPMLPDKVSKGFKAKIGKLIKKRFFLLFLLLIIACSQNKPMVQDGKEKTISYLYIYSDDNDKPTDSLKLYANRSFEKSLELYTTADSLEKTIEHLVYINIFKLEKDKFAVIADSAYTTFYKFEKGKYNSLFKYEIQLGVTAFLEKSDLNNDACNDVFFTMRSGGSYGDDNLLLFYDQKKHTLIYNNTNRLRNAEIDKDTVKSSMRFYSETFLIQQTALHLIKKEEYLEGDHSAGYPDRTVITKFDLNGRQVSTDTLQVDTE